jgi:hypothetical protein
VEQSPRRRPAHPAHEQRMMDTADLYLVTGDDFAVTL